MENGRIQTKAYWTPFPEDDRTCASFEATVDELSYLIRDWVKRQMISDVPLGTFCSGGVDSSLVTAIAAGFAGALSTRFPWASTKTVMMRRPMRGWSPNSMQPGTMKLD